MQSDHSYQHKIDRLRVALHALPTSLPSGSSIYDFRYWTLDPDKLDLLGAPCSVLNADLENIFGLRAVTPLTFRERGTGIESIVDLFSYYLAGNFQEKALLSKWVEDLSNAAEEMSQFSTEKAKRVSKPSAALKRSLEYVQDEQDESAARKKQRAAAADKISQRSAKIAQTAQKCNWRFGFDDLEDIDAGPKLYTTGRRGFPVITKLVIECRRKMQNAPERRRASEGCVGSWSAPEHVTRTLPVCSGAYAPLLSKPLAPERSAAFSVFVEHATEECLTINPGLKEEASIQCDNLALGTKVLKLPPKQHTTKSVSGTRSTGSSQPSVASIVTSEGRKAKQARFDLCVVNYLAAGQLPTRSVDLPEFHAMISEASVDIRPKKSSHIASSHIPMESSRIRRQAVSELQKCKHLTISFDGGTALCAVGFTTIHVTTPDTRIAHLMKGVEASGVSHTGEYYFDELEKVIQEIGPLNFSAVSCDSTGSTRSGRERLSVAHPTILILPDPCHQLHNAIKDIYKIIYFQECLSLIRKVAGFFSRSNFAATHLRSLCARLGITQGIQKAGKTRFAGWYYSASSVQRCLPAIERLVEDGIIEVKKDHKLSFIKNIVTLGRFKTELQQFIKITEPFAKALKCLESGHSTASDVFIFNLAIMASLRLIFDDNESGLGLPDSVIHNVQEIASSRYFDMVLASGREVYLAAFILDPRYANSTVLGRNNLNPLDRGKIVLRPPRAPTSSDHDLHRIIPCFDKVGLFLKKMLCHELSAATIPAAQDYVDGKSVIDAFKSQLVSYVCGEHPFTIDPSSRCINQPLVFWKRLLKHPDACFVAALAVKLFSVVPNSMAEERTVSCFTKLNTKDRSRQKISTLVHMTRIRQALLRDRNTTPEASKPILKFRDLSTTLLAPRPVIKPVIELEVFESTDDGHDERAVGETGTEEADVVESIEEENGSDDLEEAHEAVSPDVRGFDVAAVYGVDLSNPVLLDLLADQAVGGVEEARSGAMGSEMSHTKPSGERLSAKKDVSTVDLDVF